MNNIPERLADAYTLATQSPDESNQNGAIIYRFHNLLSTGYNHFYPGVPLTQKRPEKYDRIVHAEMDACLSLLTRVCKDTVMFCPWAACKQCALAILGSQIPTLVIHYERCHVFMETREDQQELNLKDWQPDINESAKWLKNGGCEIVVHRGPVPFDSTIKVNGRPWSPKTLEFAEC